MRSSTLIVLIATAIPALAAPYPVPSGFYPPVHTVWREPIAPVATFVPDYIKPLADVTMYRGDPEPEAWNTQLKYTLYQDFHCQMPFNTTTLHTGDEAALTESGGGVCKDTGIAACPDTYFGNRFACHGPEFHSIAWHVPDRYKDCKIEYFLWEGCGGEPIESNSTIAPTMRGSNQQCVMVRPEMEWMGASTSGGAVAVRISCNATDT